MSIGLTIWLVGAGATGLFWLVRAIAVEVNIRRREVLRSDSYDGPPENPPMVSVVLAAKDEENNIEACITSLLAQDYPNFEIVVIDDRSTDRTPQLLEDFKRKAAGKIKILTIKTLKGGWFGKSRAVHEGMALCEGDYFLFTDADCVFMCRSTISMAMRESLAHDTDFLCITPVLETRTAWERIIQPVCALVLIVWHLPRRVNNPARKTAYANGAFMLLREACYKAIGGHERVRNEINEDVWLARYAKRMGYNLRVVENDELYRTRMYDRFDVAFRGWSRIFFGCIRTLDRLATAAALLLLLSIGPWISLAVAAIGYITAGEASLAWWQHALTGWALAVGMLQISMWRMYPLTGVRAYWSITYVFGALFALAAVIRALLTSLGITGTTWRGTTYRVDRQGSLETAPRG